MFHFSNCFLLRLWYKRTFSFFNMINLKRRAKSKTNFSAYRGKTVGAAPSDTANSGEEADSLSETTEQEDKNGQIDKIKALFDEDEAN